MYQQKQAQQAIIDQAAHGIHSSNCFVTLHMRIVSRHANVWLEIGKQNRPLFVLITLLLTIVSFSPPIVYGGLAGTTTGLTDQLGQNGKWVSHRARGGTNKWGGGVEQLC